MSSTAAIKHVQNLAGIERGFVRDPAGMAKQKRNVSATLPKTHKHAPIKIALSRATGAEVAQCHRTAHFVFRKIAQEEIGVPRQNLLETCVIKVR